MKKFIATGLFCVALSLSASVEIPELGLVLDVPPSSEWTMQRQGDPRSSGGFALSLTQVSGTRIFAVTGRIVKNPTEGPLHLTPAEEKESASIGKEVSRRKTVIAGFEAIELRLELVDDGSVKRAVVTLFETGKARCCLISIITQHGQSSIPAWPDEDPDLRPLLTGIRLLEEEPNQALQPTRMLVTFCAYAQPAPSTRVAVMRTL